jgi:Cysteine-rich secretory protein family
MASYSLETANTCYYAHSHEAGDGNYGQNIGAGAPFEDIPALITNLMYDYEIELYSWYGSEPPPMNEDGPDWGHYTQIVWKSTREVGCATVKCDVLGNTPNTMKPFFTVCDYFPAGKSRKLILQIVFTSR